MRLRVDDRDAYAYTGGRPFDAARPVVVFVHGAEHDHSVWALQSRYLAHHGWSVLAFDLPGHGRSQGPALATIEAMADWVLRAIAAACGRADTAAATAPAAPAARTAATAARSAAGSAPASTRAAVLVGHSMGSLVALEAGARAPDSVAALCLVATAFPMAVSDALLAAARDDEPRALDMINVWSHSRLTSRPGSPAPGCSAFVANRRLMERQARGVLLNDFQACNAYALGLERGAALRCPTLVLLGSRDQMTPPRAARDLIARIAGVRVVEIAGSGHNLMNEAPDAVLDALRRWLDMLPCARSSAVG